MYPMPQRSVDNISVKNWWRPLLFWRGGTLENLFSVLGFSRFNSLTSTTLILRTCCLGYEIRCGLPPPVLPSAVIKARVDRSSQSFDLQHYCSMPRSWIATPTLSLLSPHTMTVPCVRGVLRRLSVILTLLKYMMMESCNTPWIWFSAIESIWTNTIWAS